MLERIVWSTECTINTVGPTEAVLTLIFAASRLEIDVHHVVFFHHLARPAVDVAVKLQPASANLLGQDIVLIAIKTRIGHPLMRSPAVGEVPLFIRGTQGCDEPAGFENSL